MSKSSNSNPAPSFICVGLNCFALLLSHEYLVVLIIISPKLNEPKASSFRPKPSYLVLQTWKPRGRGRRPQRMDAAKTQVSGDRNTEGAGGGGGALSTISEILLGGRKKSEKSNPKHRRDAA